jgi:hypothetical protein
MRRLLMTGSALQSALGKHPALLSQCSELVRRDLAEEGQACLGFPLGDA